MIDWKLARNTAVRLSSPGPDATTEQIADVVGELRAAAERAVLPVEAYTGLVADPTSPVLVVDRSRWIEANLDTFAELMDPMMDQLTKTRSSSPAMRAVTQKVSGAEVGAAMAFLSSKVLGQFDPFYSDGPVSGRLLLVAPNVLRVERELGVDPSDFRQWVCLHEETHRAQFTGVPWMQSHMKGLVDQFVDITDTPQTLARIMEQLPEVLRIVRGESDASLSDLFSNERQRRLIDEMTGLMSLLEGHADVVMDDAGPELIGSVKTIRRRFDQRRGSGSGLAKIVRRLLGLEAKMRQYRDGAVFVREVVRTVGDEGFSAVWAEPANLPSKTEIGDPASWVARVHG